VQKEIHLGSFASQDLLLGFFLPFLFVSSFSSSLSRLFSSEGMGTCPALQALSFPHPQRQSKINRQFFFCVGGVFFFCLFPPKRSFLYVLLPTRGVSGTMPGFSPPLFRRRRWNKLLSSFPLEAFKLDAALPPPPEIVQTTFRF